MNREKENGETERQREGGRERERERGRDSTGVKKPIGNH